MDGLGRTGGNHHIYRMLLQIRTQELHRRPHPSGTRVGNEEIAAYPQHQPLLPTLFLGIDGVHARTLGRPAPHKLMVDGIGLANGLLQHLRLRGDLRNKTLVHRKLLGIGGGVDYGLPALRGKILCELQPTLDTRTSGGRPIVAYDENPTHRVRFLLSSPGAGRMPA